MKSVHRREDCLYRHHHWLEATAEDKVAERQTSGLVGIVIILALLVCALFLVQRLHSAAVTEDCLLAGRRDCNAPVN